MHARSPTALRDRPIPCRPGTDRPGHALARVGFPGDERSHRRGIEQISRSKAASSSVANLASAPRRHPSRTASARAYAPAGTRRSCHRSDQAALGPHRWTCCRWSSGPPSTAPMASRVLGDEALTAAGADLGDQRQHEVLGGHPRREVTVHRDGHRPGRACGSVWVARTCSTSMSRCRTPARRTHRASRLRVAADDRHAGHW